MANLMRKLGTLTKFILHSFNNSRLRQYFDHSTFNSAFPNNSFSDLSIFHVNTQSIIAIGDKLISYLSFLRRHFDINYLTETWYGDEKIAVIFFEQYISSYPNSVSTASAKNLRLHAFCNKKMEQNSLKYFF